MSVLRPSSSAYHTKNSQGFSLVELAIVLAIIGITIAGAATLATNIIKQDKHDLTHQRLDQIETALLQFLHSQQRLPCPADGTLSNTDPHFGREQTVTASGCQNANFYDNTMVYAGMVPVKTLLLPDETAVDGWNRRFSYVIDYRFANNTLTNMACNGVSNTRCFKYSNTGTIHIKGSADSTKTEEAVYVLISHGKNGHGAYSDSGLVTRLPYPQAADEKEQDNSGDDRIIFDNVFVQQALSATFDDHLRYKLKWQLLADAQAIQNQDLCDIADNVANIPNFNIACSNANDESRCEMLARQVNQWCLGI